MQHPDDVLIEGGNIATERPAFNFAIAAANYQFMREQIQLRVEGAQTDRDAGGRQPACGDVKRNVSPLWLRWAERQPQLADHLRVHVQRVFGLAPVFIGKRGPLRIARAHRTNDSRQVC